MNVTTMRITLGLILAAVLLGSAFAQRPPRGIPARSGAAPATPEKEEPEEEKEDAWLLVKGGDVYTVSGPVRRGVSILCKNGKIDRIGEELHVPKGAEVLDAKGMRVYPGLVAINGSGLIGKASGGKDKDAYDAFGFPNAFALGFGITTIISGTTALKVTYGTVDDIVIREGLYLGLFYSSRNPATKRRLLEDLKKARDFIRATLEYEAKKKAGDKEAKPPNKAQLGSGSRYVPLLEGKTFAVFNVSRAKDIREACELIEMFRFKAVLRGCDEGWVVPGVIGRAGAMAVVTPRRRLDPDESVNRPNGSSIENAAKLYEHGVPVAIAAFSSTIEVDGSPGRDGLALTTSAAYAVRGGLSEKAAIDGITIDAARAFGIDDRVGSIEVGKDADLILTDGELLHYKTLVQYAIVNGKVAYDKEKLPFLRHVRPRKPEHEIGPQWWPRPFGPMPTEWEHDAKKAGVAALDALEKERKEKAEKKKKADELKKKREAAKKKKDAKSPAKKPTPKK